ncbi:myosin regulatory light chain 2 [Drosophila miranda]|uniref:Myosin regulatory light chain 2 n=3 Tax=obscura group TaxID=32355 RepID=A0A6I8UM26_DROPS|nr:myosin regulatory light chain 2 [Drosophila pseudoobscura]XP_017144965.1 myosin regulatory light chain 2 [Drosophila miranda]XP_034140642.1 myosin regulatory light chain 2 [Drosophila guanche]SPP89940.1 blast:Myosin regulatory light chain 2 [Drosophila guanche]
MADEKKKVKKKKTKEEGGTSETASEAASEAATPAPVATPAPAASATGSKRASGGSRGSRKSKRAGSSVFSVFSQKQIAEFKEAFQLMDADKDGIIGKNDLRAAFDSVGKIANDKELDAMLSEASGPINFTQLLTLFANRMASAGANDEDDVVIAAFKTFDNDGLIDGDKFREMLMNFGDKFTMKEVDDAYDQMVIDDKNQIDTGALIEMLTGKGEEEEEEAA